MKCLDTDLLIAILRGKEEAREAAADLDEESRAATTFVNAFELFFGANRSARKNENVKEASRLLERLVVFPLDLSSSRIAAEISTKLLAKGDAIDYRDAMIAAITINNGAALYTFDLKHFSPLKALGLKLFP